MILNDSKSNGRHFSPFYSDTFTCLIRLFRTLMFSYLNASSVVCDIIFTPASIYGFVLVSHDNLCLIVRKDSKIEPLGGTSSSFAYGVCSKK